MSIKSTHIKLNRPNKVLSTVVTNITGVAYWPFANGAEDKWYEGSTSPRYYRWELTLSVTEQGHGSHLTREPFVYNGLDIVVGDWIAGASDGKCLKVVAIYSKTETQVVLVAEDWLRYNTFKATTGNGIFNTGPAIVFGLNENGMPILDPMPTIASTDFFAIVMSRFQYLNPQMNYVLEQHAHGFVPGDVIAATSNGFVKADATTANRTIGMVTEAGPGPNHFIISPNKRIIDLDPNIPGEQGDYIYVDPNTGQLSNTAVEGRLMYLNVQGPLPTVLTGTVASPTVPQNHEVFFNGYSTVFTGATDPIQLTSIVNHINAGTEFHEVAAKSIPIPVTVSSVSSSTAYGLVGGYVPFSAYFATGNSNVLVNFTTSGSQYPGVSTPEDMAIDINAAGIPSLVAEATVNTLTLKQVAGGSITISNGTPDTNGFNFVGTSNISGLPAFVDASAGSLLELRRDDGGEILIYEQTAFFANNVGITSGHNGTMALAMYIEEGVRTGGITVVADIASRDNLNPQTGDMVYVINKGDGEWGMYLYTGSVWEITGTADSATVDAKTIVAEFNLPLPGINSTTILGNISSGRKITTVSVDVVEALSGHSSTPSVTVGTATDQALFLDENSTDLTDPGTYFNFPEYIHEPLDGQDLQVQAFLNHYGAITGNVIVKVTYI